MNAGVAPLLLGRSGSVARTPCCHPAIVGFTKETHRHTRRSGLSFETVRIRETALPFRRVAGTSGFDTAIRAEADVGRGILPILGPKSTDLGSALPFPCFAEAGVVLRWPEAHPYCLLTNASVALRSAAAVGSSEAA
jgi:hypothetical protein